MSFLRTLGRRIARSASSTWRYARRHKVQAVLALLVLASLAWWGAASYAASVTTTQYALAAAQDGAIQVTVTDSGTVSAQHQLDLIPKASGTLSGVYVTPGEYVHAGQLVATVDDTTAAQQLQDASANLAQAKIDYQNALANDQSSITNTQDALTSATGSGFDAVAVAQNDLPSIMQDLRNLYQGNRLIAYANTVSSIDPSVEPLLQNANSSYLAAANSYAYMTSKFQEASRSSSPADIAALLESSYQTMVDVTQAVKDIYALMDRVRTDTQVHNDVQTPSDLATELAAFSGYIAKVNTDTASVRTAQTALTTAEQNAAQSAATGGTTVPLSIQSAQIALQKAQNAYAEAQTTLSDYVVRAPFDGTIAEVDLQKFDQAGGSAKVATLVTNQAYADLSMNETDAANVQPGQPATITFDAIDGLTVQGTVAEVSGVGTVTQGVTTYDVKVSLDTQDPRVKPGMSVEATITTASKDSALLVPAAAVKSVTAGGQTSYYVEAAAASSTGVLPSYAGRAGRFASTSSSTRAFMGGSGSGGFAGAGSSSGGRGFTVDASRVTVTRVPVTIGLQNDTMTEITSGLAPGQFVVTQSLNAKGGSTTQSRSILNLFGGNRGGAQGAARPAGAGGNASFRGGAPAAGGGRGFGG